MELLFLKDSLVNGSYSLGTEHFKEKMCIYIVRLQVLLRKHLRYLDGK